MKGTLETLQAMHEMVVPSLMHCWGIVSHFFRYKPLVLTFILSLVPEVIQKNLGPLTKATINFFFKGSTIFDF